MPQLPPFEKRLQIWRRRIIISIIFCVVMGIWWGLSAWFTPPDMIAFRDGAVVLLILGLLSLGLLWGYRPTVKASVQLAHATFW